MGLSPPINGEKFVGRAFLARYYSPHRRDACATRFLIKFSRQELFRTELTPNPWPLTPNTKFAS